MAINPLAVTSAYHNQQKLMQGATASDGTDDSPAAGGASGSSFAQLVENALSGAMDAQTQSETLQMQSLTGAGKVDLSDLVTAVANAELSLNTVVAIRDRVINAYNDIIKMAI